MSGYSELAELFYERNNLSEYTPMIGKIVALPELKIQLGTKGVLDKDDIKSTFDIYERTFNEDGEPTGYLNLNREVLLLPSKTIFFAIGVIR